MDKTILLLSGDHPTIAAVKEALDPQGYNVRLMRGLPSMIRAMKGQEIVIIDMPDGAEPLRETMAYHPEATAIVIGGDKCVRTAAEEGAFDCIPRPADSARIRLAVRNAFRHRSVVEELWGLKSQGPEIFVSHRNANMYKAVRQANRASSKDTPVLITGEEGSGISLVARMLHYSGRRRSGPFVHVGPGADLGTRLFGDGKAAGAVLDADGGTLFIEDVNGLDAGLKERLCAMVKAKAAGPANGGQPYCTDARLVCGANGMDRDDPALKCFAFEIKLPALKDRKEDIVPLAEHFLAQAEKSFRTGPKALTKDAVKALQRHRWPGNVVELQNVIRKACLLSTGRDIEGHHLCLNGEAPAGSVRDFLEVKLRKYLGDMARLEKSGIYSTVMSEVEKALIELALAQTDGNQLKAAKALGINRTTLRTKIKNYKVKVGTKG